jgi:hypothetical protein
MPEVLPTEPAQGNEWERERQDDKEEPGCAFAEPSFQKNEADNERQYAVHHVAQQQAPVKKLHRESW